MAQQIKVIAASLRTKIVEKKYTNKLTKTLQE